jgi:hypothetical protein
VPKLLSDQQVAAYERDGYVFPIKVMEPADARNLRGRLESVEKDSGGALSGSLRFKPHLLHPFLDNLIRHSSILDAVEDVIGPNILCWASSFFTKEAQDPGYVSWHQDATYWGLSEPDVVTAWIAMSPSTVESGCMRVIPGSHKRDQLPHVDKHGKANLLSRGQEIQVDVDEREAVDVVLAPGEISLHHVRLIHGSEPNRSADRRIGFAVRYIPTYVRQVNGPQDTAMLVRGVDTHHNFELEPRPEGDLHPDAVAWHSKAAEIHGQLLYQGTERQPFS